MSGSYVNEPENIDSSSRDFEKSYEQGRLPAVRKLMQSVLGCDYGGTSWTTRSQADQIADSLELKPGVRLLDVGAGSGWPGLFLADTSGCDVTLVDIPVFALQQASERAAEDNLGQRCHTVAASGAALPFRDGAFDSVSHSDVLCCMPDKVPMLRECRRVVTDEAKMSFSVIMPAPALSEPDWQDAVSAGPPFVEVDDDYANLLSASGWRVIERSDVTQQHLQSLQVLVENMGACVAELTDALGAEELATQKQRRELQISAIQRGLLKREIFVSVAD